MQRERPLGAQRAHARDGAQHGDGEDDALDAVKPKMADAFGVFGERRESARCFKEAGEPCQPQQRPAVKPLEAKLGHGFGDKAHGRKCKWVSTRSNCRPGMLGFLGVGANVFKETCVSDSAELRVCNPRGW